MRRIGENSANFWYPTKEKEGESKRNGKGKVKGKGRGKSARFALHYPGIWWRIAKIPPISGIQKRKRGKGDKRKRGIEEKREEEKKRFTYDTLV